MPTFSQPGSPTPYAGQQPGLTPETAAPPPPALGALLTHAVAPAAAEAVPGLGLGS